MAVGVDEVEINQAPATVAEDHGRLMAQGTVRQEFELMPKLDEVRLGDVVVRSCGDEVVRHNLWNVGDRVGHDCNSSPFAVHGRERVRRTST